MRRYLFAVLAVLLAASVAYGEGQLVQVFSMDDLEALAKQESWQELVSHLGDIPPAKRTDRWGALLEQSALGVMSTYAGRTEESWEFADAVVKQYPPLKKSKKFMAARSELGLKGLDACLAHRAVTSCTDRAVGYLDADPSDAELAWKSAKLVGQRDPASAIRLYRRALEAQGAARQCGDDGVKKAVNYALMLKGEDPRVAEARTVAADLCWDPLKEYVLDRFIDGDRDFRRNACPFLLAKPGALSAISRKQCESISNPP